MRKIYEPLYEQFHSGDTVEAVSEGSARNRITVGSQYIVDYKDDGLIYVKADDGELHGVYPHRFEIIIFDEEDMSKIDKSEATRLDKTDDPNERGGSTPEQYGIPEGAIDLQDLIEHRKMNFAMGNIFKACYRVGFKDTTDELYEINKILWFAMREKNRILKEMNDVQKN